MLMKKNIMNNVYWQSSGSVELKCPKKNTKSFLQKVYVNLCKQLTAKKKKSETF